MKKFLEKINPTIAVIAIINIADFGFAMFSCAHAESGRGDSLLLWILYGIYKLMSRD